jgi:hypothetical protein
MTDSDEIIKLIENAAEGSVELEHRVLDALGDGESPTDSTFTRSVDAALALLPPAGYWELMCITNDGLSQYACEVHPEGNRASVIGTGHTAALAVAAAALKAR